jgi:hypothetical protein
MMDKQKIKRRRILRKAALRLLRSPEFFRLFLDAVAKVGLVGEEKNALAVYVACTSRLLEHPVSEFVKGASSSGKNFLVKNVLRFFPKKSFEEISSSSERAWNYLGTDLQHKIVYIQEENKAAGNIHPARLMISENQLVRIVTIRVGNTFRTERQVTKGPIVCISTTTKDRLQIDDESRHISIWTDESEEQTDRILKSQLSSAVGVGMEELPVWRGAQNLIAERSNIPFEFGTWGKHVVKKIKASDVRIRRYFPAFLSLCKTIALIRSFRYSDEELIDRGKIEVDFADFATTHTIFGTAFSQTLSFGDEEESELHQALVRISQKKDGVGVAATELAQELGISLDRAYERLRKELDDGTIRRSNEPERGNLKLYLPAERAALLPDPETVFQEMPSGDEVFSFYHPVAGQVVQYRRRKKKG